MAGVAGVASVAGLARLLLEPLLDLKLLFGIGLLLRYDVAQLVHLPRSVRRLRLERAHLGEVICDLRLEMSDLHGLSISLLLQLASELEQLVDRALLPDAQPRALLHQTAEVLDLVLELLDRLLSAPLLLMRRIDHLPRLLDLPLERGDGVLVLLRELESRLHLGRVRHDLLRRAAAWAC